MKSINLLRQFEMRSRKMLLNVEEGKYIHSTGNINESGKPLENSLSEWLKKSFPSNFSVQSGYFYGIDSECSNEVDILIYDTNESFNLQVDSNNKVYVPFSASSILGQVKNSVGCLQSAIQQSQKAINAWNEMNETVKSKQSSSDNIKNRPLSFVICGSNPDYPSNEQKIIDTIINCGQPYVDLIFIIEKGVIISKVVESDMIDYPQLNLMEYVNGRSLYFCTPLSNDSSQEGNALLWFYYTLTAKLISDQNNKLRYSDFCNAIVKNHPFIKVKKIV